MPILPYRPHEFTKSMGPNFNASSQIECGWPEIVRAAITVGRRNWADVVSYGSYSLLECLWRVAMVRANLREDGKGRLVRSAAYANLDPSEKGAVSYFLGHVFTKLLCERLFGVSWLLHVDVYTRLLNPALALPVRPDFVGLDRGNRWIVAESKGRSNNIKLSLMRLAKRQTRSMRTIAGDFPIHRLAFGIYFLNERLRAIVLDPISHDERASDLPLNPEETRRCYYADMLKILDIRSGRRRRSFKVDLFGLDAELSLRPEIVAWYSGGRHWDEVVRRLPVSPFRLDHIPRSLRATEASEVLSRSLAEPLPEGYDGIAIQLGSSWSADDMRKE